jgi:hypothetical protein
VGASWQEFADEAPELAEAVRARFGAHVHHIIGTLRADGAPRLSGTEVEIDGHHLRVGMMPDSHKLADVRHDPRVEIHSAPLEPDLKGGDAKVAGRLRSAGEPEGQPGAMFELDIERVSLVSVDGDELQFTTWRPGRGVKTIRRA